MGEAGQCGEHSERNGFLGVEMTMGGKNVENVNECRVILITDRSLT